ncbi:HAMP domain-containing protein, partial [Nocardioides pantholopis]|uniref:HAMP domain-containing protein n=1 Tax=Nocardioides pantholopis TaxID=2483798 RepID=UPI0013E396A4
MKNLVTWTVGRRLAAIAGIGMLSSLVICAVAVHSVQQLDESGHELDAQQDTRAALHAIDTRSSELKYDALRSVSAEDPAALAAEVEEDVATLNELVDAMPTGTLETTAEQEAAFQRLLSGYAATVTAFVADAVEDQKATRDRVAEIEAANDEVDAVLGGSIDQITAESRERAADEAGARSGTIRATILVAVLAMVILAAMAAAITRSIIRPLRRGVRTLQALAHGDLTQRVPETSAAELGEFETSLNGSIDSVARIVASVGESAEAVAGAAEELSVGTQQIAAGAEETSVQAGVVAGAAGEVSRNVSTVAAGAEQMGASIREIAHSANEAARVASLAVASVE